MPFFIKAASLALHKTPILNSHLSPTAEELTYKADHNISIAVNSAKGLVVPNIKAVQSQSVFEIAGELERLVALAQEGTLPADDLADGTRRLPLSPQPFHLDANAFTMVVYTPATVHVQFALFSAHSFQTQFAHDYWTMWVWGRDICAVEHWGDWRDVCDPGGDDTAGGDWCAGQATDAAEV